MDGGLSFSYTLEGELEDLRIPPPVPPRRTDGLWQSTCFEAFLQASPSSPTYYEFNFSPSGEWAAYRFAGYREGMEPVKPFEAPRIILRQKANRLELDVRVGLSGVPAPGEGGECRLALSAVIEDLQGGRSYWAVAHPPGKPDFHHPGSFAVKLA